VGPEYWIKLKGYYPIELSYMSSLLLF